MLNIPILRSSRFVLEMKEIAMLNAIKLANMPIQFSERQNTFLINSIIEGVEGVENPLLWTVQERMFCIGHYIAATQDESPDFAIGDAHYSDYLQGEKQYQFDTFDLGEYEGDTWTAIPLLGVMAETIERLEGEIEGIESRTHWYLGCMACQLIPNDVSLDFNRPDYDRQVLERMIVLSQMPESDFLYLMGLLTTAQTHFSHLFSIAITDVGIVALPREGGADLPYARFPASTAITTLSKQLCGKSELSSS